MKLIFKYNDKSKLLSMEAVHTCLQHKPTVNNGDNKLLVENLTKALSLIEFIVDKPINHILTKKTPDGIIYYHELELPVSDCGKYLPIKNPFPISQ